eukprot:CAMPEP_0172442002 /NCGR_PEP_ID=MMETSP1065-20121228/2480_1 /TAXON_ID=265537 /ORGANISM="Amphiprora paludosa, Strain CCMP125" /LENGTH=1034 /DNA_ID=CAMNT_0013191647 /DNA_START=121 /DNA_END=3225 /DNA_ORIENTATION=+
MSSDGSDDDEDYHAYSARSHSMEKRYPIHDACEFDDIEVLKSLILEVVPEEEENGDGNQTGDDDSSSSSSDENDSTAAAHAAATGHSPLPVKPVVGDKTAGAPVDGEAAVAAGEKADGRPQVDTGVTMQDSAIDPDDPKTPRASNATGPIDASDSADMPVVAGAVGAPATETGSANPTPMEIEERPEGKGAVESDLSDHKEAGEKGKKETNEVRYRVPPGVALNEKDEDENTALHVAIHSRKLEHVKLLLEMGASFRLKCDGSFAIHTAISMGSVRQHQQFAYECVVALHDAGADLTLKDDSNHTPLYLACMFNLPQIVSYILSEEHGLSTLNLRADRAGNRPLHAAAKFDTLTNPSLGKNEGVGPRVVVPPPPPHHHHHPDGSVVTPKPIPGFPGKVAANTVTRTGDDSAAALLTQVLLGTAGIEVDAINSLGQTALHVACARGNWPVVRLLLHAESDPNLADRRGFTPGQVAYKRGMPIPADLLATLGDPPESGIIPAPRDLIVDPDGPTAIVTHELCVQHRTCPPIRRDSSEPPPENVRRLQVLIDKDTGILKSGEFGPCSWKHEARRAAMADILKVHEYTYVESISNMAASIPDHPGAIAHLDPDTTVSRWSFEAAMRASGSVCQAVDLVLSGEYRNSFCAVRPPGHHAGPRGIVKCPNDPDGGSHGFCLLNNVAIGAAYARSMYRHEGIRKVAIIDFDVHHGNGTEEIIRQLVPVTEKTSIRTPFAFGEMSSCNYRPWLDETDIQNVFFASTHGYGNRGYEQPGWFYPASGKTHVSESITHPAMVENPNLTDFLSSQTWARMGEDSKANCCKIINVGLELPENSSDPQGRSMKQRLDLRDVYRTKILPHLREFDPDLIFISAGFDAHRKDTMNFGYVGMVEDDYEWVTEQLIKVANTCCNGRVISVLEGGYKIHGGIVSPFARSVASHVRALVDGGKSRELFDPKDMDWEAQYERHIYEKRERKKEEDKEKLRIRMEAIHRTSMLEQQIVEAGADPPEDPDAPSRKRRRNQVDYKELYKQLQEEGFARD